MPLKILHTADVHLGAKLIYLGAKAEEQRQQIRNTFSAAMDAAVSKRVDLVLIAGDLFDTPFPSKSNLNFVIAELKKLEAAGIYAALIPGNHDYLHQNSVYNSEEFMQIGSAGKIKIFRKQEVEEWKIDALGASIYASACVAIKYKNSPIPGVKLNPDSKYQIGLFHGSVDLRGQPENYPIYRSEIEKSGLDYVALGDWHSSLNIPTANLPAGSNHKVSAWYSGSPEAIASDQQDAGNVLLIEVDEERQVKVTKERVGKRQIKSLNLDLAKYTNIPAIVKDLAEYADPNTVLVLRLSGLKKLGAALSPVELANAIEAKFFYVKVIDESKLQITAAELAKYPESLVLGKFIRLLQKQLGNDEAQNDLIDEAIQYGVNLLNKNEA